MIAVLGGGVSGLAIARQLAGKGHRVVVFEAQDRAGGWVSSGRTLVDKENDCGGVLFERGPHSIRPRAEGNGLRLVQLLFELGLDKQALCSQGDHRYVYHNNALVRLPQTLREVLQTPLTRQIPWHLLKDVFAWRKRGEEDETVGSFLTRKLGRGAKPLVVGMVGGIFAGDPDALSIRSCFPQLVEMNRGGSLVRGMVLGSKKKPLVDARMQKLAKASSLSFPEGMGTLTNALEADCRRLGVEVKLNSAVREIDFKDGQLFVNQEPFTHVVSTLSPRTLGLALTDPIASRALGELARRIDSVDVAVANLCYRFEDIPLLPGNSFGHLVADFKTQSETGCLGVLYDSSAFPEQQPKGMVVLSVMLGGAQAKWVAKLEERELVDLARRALKQQLHITASPVESQAALHRDCIPQFQVGHAQQRAVAQQAVQQAFAGKLLLLGTGVLGVGVADSVGGGLLAVDEQIKAP